MLKDIIYPFRFISNIKFNFKNNFCILLILFMAIFLLTRSSSLAQKNFEKKYFVLDNGLQVFLYEKHTLPLLNVVAAVNVGNKDEQDTTNGLVHLLEHYILFRGTQERTSAQISQDIRRHGAHFNAHTGQDLALFEISLPAEYSDFALHNQKEILFNLKLSQKELDDEKEVIYEEISQIEDDPLKLGTSLVYQNLFKGHPYQRPIYGKKENIQALTIEQVEKIYKKYFVPANCALAIVGDFDIKEMEKKVRNIFGIVTKEEFIPPSLEKAQPLEDSLEIEQEMDIQKAYLFIATQGPDGHHPDQYAVDLLTEILGRGVAPLLNTAFRTREGLVQNISMNFSAHSYGGIILTSFTADPKYVTAARKEAVSFLRKARNENYSKDDYLGEEKLYAYDFLLSAKNQIKFVSHQAQENGLSLARSLAMHMLLNEKSDQKDYWQEVNKVNSSDLRETAARYLSRNNYVIVSLLPKKK